MSQDRGYLNNGGDVFNELFSQPPPHRTKRRGIYGRLVEINSKFNIVHLFTFCCNFDTLSKYSIYELDSLRHQTRLACVYSALIYSTIRLTAGADKIRGPALDCMVGLLYAAPFYRFG